MNHIEDLFFQKMNDLGLQDKKVQLNWNRDILILSGKVDNWQQVVDIGHMAAKLPGVKKLVNHITSPDIKKEENVDYSKYYRMDITDNADVVIVGAGITGCAIARQLSKYNLSILVLEKEEDICCGTTKSNNGMVHSGYDSKPGSLKAKLNVKGNAMYSKWADELGFDFNRTGSFVLGFDEKDKKVINEYLENGKKNGVPGIEVLSGDEARKIEPAISKDAICALWTPSAGYVEPYSVAIALMENAIDNGCRLKLDCEIVGIDKNEQKVTTIITTKGKIKCRYFIDAAGLYSDDVAKMMDDEFFTIHPRRGAIAILDKVNKGKIRTFIGQAPGNFTKGGGPEETPEGTLLWGPSAKEIPDKKNLSVEEDELKFVITKSMHLISGVTPADIITYFSGNRAATYHEDFIVQKSDCIENVIYAAGIQSPGLASSPAIAERVENIFKSMEKNLVEKTDFNPIRKRMKPFRRCTMEERQKMIEKNPLYGRIICRCEMVTEGEIVDAIHGKIPALNVDAVKRRTRAGMGRCQGGFCGSKVVEILSRELNINPTEVTLKGKGSNILKTNTRQVE